MTDCISTENIYDLIADTVYLNIDDLVIIEQYLKQKLNTGRTNMIGIRNCLLRMFRYFKTTSIQDISRQMMIEYFSSFRSDHSYAYKKTVRAYIHAFFRYYQELNKEQLSKYVNPVPPLSVFSFKKPMLTMNEINNDITAKSYTDEQIIKILTYLGMEHKKKHHTSGRHYYPVTVLLLFCGMRVGEALTVRRNNLFYSNNYLVTGLEENAQKNKKPLPFCFPNEVGFLLHEFSMEKNSQSSPFIFNLQEGPRMVLNAVEGMEKFFKRLSKKIGFEVLSHSFRKTLITRMLHESKAQDHIVETLTNHAISNVLHKNYDQYSIELRKNDYFENLPKSYQKFIDLIKKL